MLHYTVIPVIILIHSTAFWNQSFLACYTIVILSFLLKFWSIQLCPVTKVSVLFYYALISVTILIHQLGRVKQICVFEHSVMTNFNCAYPAIQAFCLKVPLDSRLVWASSGGSGKTARMRRLAWTFAARIGDKYQIHSTRPNCILNHLFCPVIKMCAVITCQILIINISTVIPVTL